jgi:hypothetical protein
LVFRGGVINAAGLLPGDTVEVLNVSGQIVASATRALADPSSVVVLYVSNLPLTDGTVRAKNISGAIVSSLTFATIASSDYFRFSL